MATYTVKNVFSKGFVSVREEDTLSSCLSLLKKETLPALAVLDSEGKYKGVLARRWIIRSMLNPSSTKVKTLMRPAPTVTLQGSLSEVARLMIESGVRQLPVYDGEKLLGFVTDEDVIHGVVMQRWGDVEIKEIMTKRLFVVEEDKSLGSVLSLFRDYDISHAPVVSKGKLVGMISIHDLIEYVFQPRKRQGIGERRGEKIRFLSAPVKSVMSKPVITVLPETRLRDAEKKMSEFDISCLVISETGRPTSIVTKRDFLESIAQMEMVKPELTVQFSVKDVKIDEFQRGFIIDDFESFARRYRETLEAGTLYVYMKGHGTNYKGKQLIHCRLQLRTRKGSFFSSSEGWNVEPTFHLALDRLEKQILRSKEFEHDPEFTRIYLRRMRFPSTEL